MQDYFIIVQKAPKRKVFLIINQIQINLKKKQDLQIIGKTNGDIHLQNHKQETLKKQYKLQKKHYSLNKNDKSGLSSDWRLEGPTNIGGRANCILVDSRDTNTIYIGMAAGGIFKTTNGGGNWLPITDDFAYLSISQIIQDPLYPDTIFASTGDRNFGSWGRIGD